MRRLPALALLLLAVSCTTFETPVPLAEVLFRERSLTKTVGPLTVTVAVPTIEETRDLFGTNLEKSGIQPVWSEVDNDSDEVFWLLPPSVDPDYFAPLEAAYTRHTFLRGENDEIDALYEGYAFPNPVLPNAHTEGFIYTNLDFGAKAFETHFIGEQAFHQLAWVVPVPGLKTDVERVDYEELLAAMDIRELSSYAELRSELELLAQFTANEGGSKTGDPVNLVLIGPPEAIFTAFVRRGWHQTELLTIGSAWRTFWAFLFGGEYRHSPISPQYVYGRVQDTSMQKARGSIHMRNHLRIWRAPYSFGGEPVYAGQISRDIGVILSAASPSFTTHKIDPDVDEARDGLLMDMFYSRHIQEFGWVGGVEPATREEPRGNLTGDLFYTDGLRIVLFFSADEIPFTESSGHVEGWPVPYNVQRADEAAAAAKAGAAQGGEPAESAAAGEPEPASEKEAPIGGD